MVERVARALQLEHPVQGAQVEQVARVELVPLQEPRKNLLQLRGPVGAGLASVESNLQRKGREEVEGVVSHFPRHQTRAEGEEVYQKLNQRGRHSRRRMGRV